MYSVKVRDHIMVAHSLPSPFFGPAQGLHGASYIVDAEFFARELNEYRVVLDIGLAHKILAEVLEELNYKNLDNMPAFQKTFSTTEYLAWYIHSGVRDKIAGQFKGRLKITLGESHIAWASYEGDV